MRILDTGRAGYKRKFSDDAVCVFCERDEVLECPGLTGKYWRVVVNRFPYMDGNVMLIPLRHIEKIGDMSVEEWQEFGVVLVRTQEVLGKIFKTQSFNVGLNTGPESGASIAHLHWQVVPRKFQNVTVMNTFADLHIVTIAPDETQRLIDEALRS